MSSQAPPVPPITTPAAFVRPAQSKGSIALDQWRGFALILVLVSHGFLFTDLVNGIGRIGVNMFFFISGILVFRSLDKETSSAWPLMKHFWLRRLRRLYPALLVYVLVMLAVTPLLQRIPYLPPMSDVSTYLHSLPWALFYGMDYYPHHARSLGHLWSLACEVQFYALAPAIFLLGGKSRARRIAVWGLITLAFVAYGFLHTVRVHNIEQGRYHFEVAVWPMMLGFFCESVKRWFLRIPVMAARAVLILGVAAMGVSLVAMAFGLQMKMLVVASGALLVWPCFACYLFGFALPGPVGRFASWTGARSYSIYLWQQPLTICNYLPAVLHPLGAALALPVGGLSFRFFEKPFLAKGRRQVLSANATPRLDESAEQRASKLELHQPINS